MVEKLISKIGVLCGVMIGGTLILSSFLAESLPVESSSVLSTTTPTQILCPLPTPIYFQVLPVSSPTDLLTQTIRVDGGGYKNTVDTGFDVFTGTRGSVDIELRPGQTHTLKVVTYEEEIVSGPCKVGGYSLSRTKDINGDPLIIEQIRTPISEPSFIFDVYLPLITSAE